MKPFIPHSKPTLSRREELSVVKVLRSAYIAEGPVVRKFEREFAHLIRRPDAVAVSSGTAALHLALLALSVKKGDEVIIPDYTCATVMSAVRYTGATPILADIDECDFNINPKSVAGLITRKTKAIIVTHMFGIPLDVRPFKKFGVPVIEDCAQALGAKFGNKPVGRDGDLAIFSFYATKMITTGRGGMVTAKSQKLLDCVRDLKEFDERSNYTVRYNYKMTDIEAALGLVQLDKLGSFIKNRADIARFYNNALRGTKATMPSFAKAARPVFYRYVIRVRKNRDAVIRALLKKGIEAKPPVFKPLHRYLGMSDGRFPVTTKIYNSVVSLPIYPSLTRAEQAYIVSEIKNII
ncbi:MAG: DegT/DnrJ/EryC1/StrS family aminotransferase [Candidatus Omnitrophica bacterium]|nr:DegT/DnrJ/EryC1/StrS family aminotransferase [Candidatus Omnitrophota bacterium]